MAEDSGRDAILRHLATYGVRDKDAAERKNGRRVTAKKIITKNSRGIFRRTIDLHGMTADTAEQSLAAAVSDCARHGIGELLVIHGWGQHSNPAEGGVLKKVVRDTLDYRLKLSIKNYASALPKDGGEGATLIKIK